MRQRDDYRFGLLPLTAPFRPAVLTGDPALATLAIASRHMYWVAIDPEAYPMDWSWWTGVAPATRVPAREGRAGDVEPADARVGQGDE